MNFLYNFQLPYQQTTIQPTYNHQDFGHTQTSSVSSKLVTHHCQLIKEKAKSVSTHELSNVFDELLSELNRLERQQKKANLYDIASVLIHVSSSTLISVAQHKFFNLFQTPFVHLLYQWNRASNLNENDVYMFRNMIRILKVLSRNAVNHNLYPAWLLHSSAINGVANCLTNIGESDNFLNEKNPRVFKNFTRIIDMYMHYQERLNNEDSSNKDLLFQLIDAIIRCLTSKHYIQLFKKSIHTDNKSMKTQQGFFLNSCPAFLALYTGSRLDEIMGKLLSTMLPRYIRLFDDIIPSINQWSLPTIQAAYHLLELVSHGDENSKIIATHLPFIDHVLNIIDTPTLYNKVDQTLSKPEAVLIHNAINFLAEIVSEPTILSHIKQKKLTPSFLRLASARYEPLVYNIYTLLAYTTSEEDIKEMHNPGVLLSTVNKKLQTVITQKPDDHHQIEQLLETLKGLVQHDQLKEEVLKQNALPFLLECTNKLTGSLLKLLVEILWALSFSPEAALQLRNNPQFLEKVQTMSKETNDEAMKKASDGLVWKLVQEPAFLEKIAKKSEEGDTADEALVETTEVIIGPDGKEQIVTKTRRSSVLPSERTFQYDMMISYCHADQDLIRKIHQFLLGEGFKIWIDLNNMFGPAMSAMAEAVENSEFVLICMSDSYKQSTYCQAEAEYAFGCKRRLLPLIVRPGYRADGWLGFMMGSRIYVDFGFFDFDKACEKLMNEISLQRKRPLPSKAAPATQQAKPVETTASVAEKVKIPATPTKLENSRSRIKPSGILPDIFLKRNTAFHFQQKPIDQWVEPDVLDFLFNHRLNAMMPLCESMDGPALLKLYKMSNSHSNRTYNSLNDELTETYDIRLPIAVFTRFLSIIERALPKPQPPPIKIIPPPPQPPPITELPFSSAQPPISLRQLDGESSVQVSVASRYSPFDIVVTSNTPALELLEMVERCVPQIRALELAQRRQPLHL